MIKLTDLLNEGLGPSSSTIKKIEDFIKRELKVSNVKGKKYSQGRARVGYTFYPEGTKNGLYIDQAYDNIWNIYTVNANGFPLSNHWEIKKYEDDIEDEDTALKAAFDVIKKFGKKDLVESVNEEFTAVSNKSGKTVVFKDKDSRDAAVKAGTHEVPEDENGGKDEPKGDNPNMFSKDAGYDAPDSKSDEPTSSDTQNSMDDVALSTKEDGSMDWKSSMNVEKILNNMLGNDGGTADVNDNGAIEYTIPDKDGNWGKALYIGTHPDDRSKFFVSIESPYDTSYFDETNKEFDNEKDAMAYAAELAKKYEKDFANEGTIKLTDLLKEGKFKKEEKDLKNLAGTVKIDFEEAFEMLKEDGVLEAIEHLENAIERIQYVHKQLKRKS